MREVQFKNKQAKHSLLVKGKRVEFVDGKAFVSEEEARLIEERGDKDYTVKPSEKVHVKESEPVKEEPKKKQSKPRKPRRKTKK